MYGVGIGTNTSTGGEVVEGNAGIKFNGLVGSSIGHQATCNSGRKECNGIGPIVPVGPRDTNLPAGPVARVGDYVDCGCPPNSNVIVGSSSVSVGAASAGGVATAQSLQAVSTQAQNVASYAAQASGASKSTASLNPNNAYWLPYNPLAQEGEKT
ncbi:PAAR domain-containing protein [Vibrio brasiliensis]|nr:PAAR domain-containing protein [Vibrio brasiliensis]MCG9785500.1 PAAR domain-containing protein [Vibrio brasiliensis]